MQFLLSSVCCCSHCFMGFVFGHGFVMQYLVLFLGVAILWVCLACYNVAFQLIHFLHSLVSILPLFENTILFKIIRSS